MARVNYFYELSHIYSQNVDFIINMKFIKHGIITFGKNELAVKDSNKKYKLCLWKNQEEIYFEDFNMGLKYLCDMLNYNQKKELLRKCCHFLISENKNKLYYESLFKKLKYR